MFKASAPGKIHLIGEHAVVYGYPAIIAAINKRIKINLKPGKKIKIAIIGNGKKLKKEFEIKECKETAKKALKLWDESNKKGDFSLLFNFLKTDVWLRLKAMIGYLFVHFKIEKGVSLEIKSEISSGMGLGSSAALSVTLTKGISSLFGIKLTKNEINKIAYEIEKLNHGKPSGGDNTVSAFGGLICFYPLSAASPKTLKYRKEKLKIPYFLKNLIIVLTKREGSTAQLIQKVKNLDQNLRKSLIEDIGRNAGKLRVVIEKEDFENFKKIINKTQDNLKKLQVSTPKIDGFVEKIRNIGGAAKLSGAGGGGAVLCFHSDKEKLTATLRKLRIHFFETEIEKEGVKMELTH